MGSRVKSNKDFSVLQAIIPLKALARRLSFFIFLAISAAIIIIGRSDRESMEQFRAVVVDAVVPVLEVLSSPAEAVSNMKNNASRMMFVYDENKELRQENAKLMRVQVLAEKLEIENRRLKDLLHLIPDSSVSYIAARVVTGVSGPYSRSAVISAGKEVDVKKGSMVVNDKGLVGRITDVGENSSRILLITDINSKIPIVTGFSGERGIVSGDNSDLLSLIHLPLDTKVKLGEKVVTSGDGKFFPPGIPIGTVESVSSKVVTVKPFVSWGRLSYVSVADYKALE